MRTLARKLQTYPTKPWPIIAKFLGSIPPGHIGLDSGTGNGKYLPLPGPSSPMIGLDRSWNLLQIARHAGSRFATDSSSLPTTINEVVQADVLNKCWRAGVFVRFARPSEFAPTDLKQDYAVSIATIHHLATVERRKVAMQVLFTALRLYSQLTTPAGTNSSRFPGSWTSAYIRVGNRAR